MPTREERRERDRRKRNRERAGAVAFAILLQITANIPQVLLEPWGFLSLVVSVGMLVVLFWTMESADRLDIREKCFGAFCIVQFAFVVGWIVLPPKWKAEKAATLDGDLVLVTQSANGTPVYIGEGGGPLPSLADEGEIFADAKLTLENDNGRILVSTVVRDDHDNVVVSLEKNHWTVTQYCLDKNYTSDSLEVKDHRGHIVFQMRLYHDHITLQGEWFNRGQGVMIVFNRKDHDVSQIIYRCPHYDRKLDAIMIEPIFEYPSAKHWAEWLAIDRSSLDSTHWNVQAVRCPQSQSTDAGLAGVIWSNPVPPMPPSLPWSFNAGYSNIGPSDAINFATRTSERTPSFRQAQDPQYQGDYRQKFIAAAKKSIAQAPHTVQTLGIGVPRYGTIDLRDKRDAKLLSRGLKVIEIRGYAQWEDSTGAHEIDNCNWLQPPPTNYKPRDLVWHTCK